MALIRLNIVMALTPQSSKCTSLKMVGIQVHQTRIQHCADNPAGFYWYWEKRSGPGRPPKWTNNISGSKKPSRPQKQSQRHKTQSEHRNINPKLPRPTVTYSLGSTRPCCSMSLPLTKPGCTLGSSFLRAGGDVMEPMYCIQTHLHLLTCYLHMYWVSFVPGLLCLISIFIDGIATTKAYCSCDIYTHVLVIDTVSWVECFCHLDSACALPLMLHINAVFTQQEDEEN